MMEASMKKGWTKMVISDSVPKGQGVASPVSGDGVAMGSQTPHYRQVPKGQTTVAHGFNRGVDRRSETSPEGAAGASAVPLGLDDCRKTPGDESPGYAQSSLRVGMRSCIVRLAAAVGLGAIGVAAHAAAPASEPAEWTFRNHVQPVLSKAGCNSGGCHGALAGKGGFRLSLNAYDPEGDHYNITRDARGRRIEFADPARSLLLTKATAAIRHKGGKRFEAGSRDYRVLAEWIANGAKPPAEDDATLERLEIEPKQALLQKGDMRSLTVRAHYSDGSVEDVTSWAKFASADETVAEVDAVTGEVKIVGHGEGAITVWFSSRIEIARVTSPFPNSVPDEVFAEAPRQNFVDDLVLDQLRSLNLPPSDRASDEVFMRRAYLDAIGVLPTPAETIAFLTENAPDKRDRLIRDLLTRSEYVDYWTYHWSDVFLVNGRLLRPDAVKAYYEWLRGEVAANTPWDELARHVVTSKGDSLKNGASNFFAVHQDPESMAENVSQAFLSLSIGCAKCHNHPLEKWTNDQYYSFANLFSRVRAKGWGGDARNGDGRRTLYIADRGELIQPRIGRPQPPAPLDGEPLPFESDRDRREYLADWLTSPENPYFTKAVVNRVWAAFMGTGLVEMVDDLRVSNPPSNEPLLDALAAFLVEKDYDLKALMRLIMSSETYQRSSDPLPGNRDDKRYYSRYFPRRLMAEVLHDAVADITQKPSVFDNLLNRDGSRTKTPFYGKGTRALQLFDSAVDNYFLQAFGRNKRDITCDCERSNQPSMIQALHLSNGSTLNDKLRAQGSCVDQAMEGADAGQIVDRAYLLSLSRSPTAKEREGLVKLLSETPEKEKRAAVEDLFWALMTSREFLFQH